MAESIPEKKPSLTKFFQLDQILRIIGFVADTITILSLLFAIRLDSLALPSIITPGFALGIWCIFSYTYLTYLHRYWEMNMLEKQFHKRFGIFLVDDLVLHFRSPFVLLPALVLIILLVAILASDSTILGIAIVLGIFIVPIIAVLGGSYVQSIRGELRDEENKIKHEEETIQAKSFVDTNWTSLRKRIQQELENKQWIYAKALSDIAMVRGIDESAMDYALAKYATENATTTKYAYVNRKSDRARISGYGKVLINLQNLNHDNYYYVDGLFD